jgi:hypothetical protein
MGRVIPLGGRFFAPAETTTSRQDGWIVAQFEDAGLIDLASSGALESNQAAARKVIVAAMGSGAYHRILAGLLVEADQKWSVESAEKNAAFFGELTDPEDKARLMPAFVETLPHFFRLAVGFSPPSPTASTNGHGPTAPAQKNGRRSTGRRAAPGPTSPAGSSTPTPAESTPSSTGL